MLDENVLADGHDYFALGDFEVTPDQTRRSRTPSTPTAASATRCASATSTTGADLPDVVADVYYGARVGRTTRARASTSRPDDAMRPCEVWRHTLGTPAADDVLVFQEDDERFYVGVGAHAQRTLRR